MSNVTRYVGLIDGKRGAYGVVIPDFPGCTAMGRTIEEALHHASEAALEWCAAVSETNAGKLPKPRPMETVLNDPEIREDIALGAVPMIMPVIFEARRPTKANLSLDAGLLRAIDEAATAHGLTRSAFLASAARDKIMAEG